MSSRNGSATSSPFVGSVVPRGRIRRVTLNPARDRCVDYLPASLDPQFLNIPIGKGISKIPPDGAEDDVRDEMPPSQDRRSLRFCDDLAILVRYEDFCNTSGRTRKGRPFVNQVCSLAPSPFNPCEEKGGVLAICWSSYSTVGKTDTRNQAQPIGTSVMSCTG